MNAKILLMTSVLFFMSCANQQKQSRKKDLIDAVIESIDSKAFPEKIVAVIKLEYANKDHNLYYIYSFRDYMIPDFYPYEIKEIKDKLVFFFSFEEEGLPCEEVDKIIEEFYDRSFDLHSSTAFYFAQCKSTGKKILYHAINDDMNYYEIPEIREFSCSSDYIRKDDMELITEDFYVETLDYYVQGNDTIKEFPYDIYLYLNVYNRTDSCLFFDGADSSLGNFKLVNGNDTLFFDAEISYSFVEIDDPTYQEDPEKYNRLMLESKENLSFFSKLNRNDLHGNFISLIQDSLYYCPNKALYESFNNGCIFPKESIKVITSPELCYYYNTSSSRNRYYNGKLLLEIEK